MLRLATYIGLVLMTASGCLSAKFVSNANSTAKLLHPGMTTNDVARAIMAADRLTNSSWHARYDAAEVDKWPRAFKEAYQALSSELQDRISFMDDMTVDCGMFCYNEYLCFYDNQARLVTVKAQEVR